MPRPGRVSSARRIQLARAVSCCLMGRANRPTAGILARPHRHRPLSEKLCLSILAMWSMTRKYLGLTERMSRLSPGSLWPDMMSSSILAGLRAQLFLLRRTAMFWLTRLRTVLWTLLDWVSMTPIRAWSLFRRSTPLTMTARRTITMTLQSIRLGGSKSVRISRTVTLKITTARDIGRWNYPRSISGGTLTLLAEVLVWTISFSVMLTFSFVKIAYRKTLLARMWLVRSCLYSVRKMGSRTSSVSAPSVKVWLRMV